MNLTPLIYSCASSVQQHERGGKAEPPHLQLKKYVKLAARFKLVVSPQWLLISTMRKVATLPPASAFNTHTCLQYNNRLQV